MCRGKSVHLPQKEGRGTGERVPGAGTHRQHRPYAVNSAGGREYVYVVVDDYTHTVYTRPLRLKSEETESGNKLRETMTDNARELSMGEVRDICERDGIKLYTTVRITLHQMGWLSAP